MLNIKVLRVAVVLGGLLASTLKPMQAQPVPEIDQPLAQINTGHKIYKLDWHPDGGILAAASADGLTLYDEALQIATQLYAGETVYSLSWNPSGDQIAVSSGVGMGLYDGTTGAFIRSLVTYNQAMVADWSPDGHYIIGNTDIYDTVDNSFLGYFSRPPVAGIGGVEWHPDGWRIAIGYFDGTIRIEDATLLPGFQVMSSQSTQAGDLD